MYPPGWVTPKPNRVDVSGTSVVVNMDKSVTLSSDSTQAKLAAAFTVYINRVRHTPTGASVDGRDVTLTMASTFSAPDDAKVS